MEQAVTHILQLAQENSYNKTKVSILEEAKEILVPAIFTLFDHDLKKLKSDDKHPVRSSIWQVILDLSQAVANDFYRSDTQISPFTAVVTVNEILPDLTLNESVETQSTERFSAYILYGLRNRALHDFFSCLFQTQFGKDILNKYYHKKSLFVIDEAFRNSIIAQLKKLKAVTSELESPLTSPFNSPRV
jgi:hypothetical protein